MSESSNAVGRQRNDRVVAARAETVDERLDAFHRRKRRSLVNEQRAENSHLNTSTSTRLGTQGNGTTLVTCTVDRFVNG